MSVIEQVRVDLLAFRTMSIPLFYSTVVSFYPFTYPFFFFSSSSSLLSLSEHDPTQIILESFNPSTLVPWSFFFFFRNTGQDNTRRVIEPVARKLLLLLLFVRHVRLHILGYVVLLLEQVASDFSLREEFEVAFCIL